ncbi:MAG: hypothetical protein KGJ93_05660, partial [Patescibacteria group bacterium]|nr:hypothetical protein [Patescibacteria group bacterium]
TKNGEQTNAVYGFTLILLKAIADIKPTHIACTFDLAGPTFRHEQYKEYKATRVKADQELYDQIPRVKEVVAALNIPIFEKQGYEADDCLGTLSQHLHQKDSQAEVIIVTGDMDTLQLVNHVIKVYTLRKGLTDVVIYDAKAVRQRFGFGPEQMVDYKALRGDPSDNIPGVTGIGEKTASELIKHFGSLDKLYDKLHQEAKKIEVKFPISNFQFPNNFKISNFKTRVLNLLIGQEEQARMSYKLATIDRQVPLKIEVPAYDFDAAHQQATVKLFQELEFRSLLNKLPKQELGGKSQESRSQTTGEALAAPDGASAAAARQDIGRQDYQFIDTEENLKTALNKLSTAGEITVDTETTSLNSIDAKLVGLGLS